jgi:dCTP deaminase
MILTDKDIKEVVKKGVIKIEPFDPNCVQPASYDFRVGEEGLTTEGEEKINVKEKGLLLLEPGDFGVISSFETIEMPNDHTARIGIRSYYSRQGLFAAT